MTIKVGKRTLAVRKPKNLDELLEQATGCNAAETARILSGHPTAGQVAAALLPFLAEDVPSAPELAAIIGDDAAVLAAVRKLYDGAAEPASTGSEAE